MDTRGFFVHSPVIDIRVVSRFWSQQIKLLWTFMCRFVWTFAFPSLGQIPRSRTAGLFNRLMFKFYRNCQTAFPILPFYIPNSSAWEFQAPHILAETSWGSQTWQDNTEIWAVFQAHPRLTKLKALPMRSGTSFLRQPDLLTCHFWKAELPQPLVSAANGHKSHQLYILSFSHTPSTHSCFLICSWLLQPLRQKFNLPLL